jgi:hypothetical protein
MLSAITADKKSHRAYDLIYFRDIVDAIFAIDNRADAEAMIEHYNQYWMTIPGSRGAVGKKTMNTSTTFGNLFEEVEAPEVEEEHHIDDSGLDETNLNNLEAGMEE